MNHAKRDAIFALLAASEPQPEIELVYDTPFQLLVAVILSAQATDVSVNRATRTLFPVAPDAQSMLALGVEGLTPHIRHIGLFNSKARHVIQTCRILLEEHGGMVPDDRTLLERLPGVGRKTANVILNTAFGQPTIAVDTHIFRVANRTRLAPGKTVRQVEDRLMRWVPPQWRHGAHHWLILHGRYVCTARRPRCDACVIAELCEYPDKRTDDGA